MKLGDVVVRINFQLRFLRTRNLGLEFLFPASKDRMYIMDETSCPKILC